MELAASLELGEGGEGEGGDHGAEGTHSVALLVLLQFVSGDARESLLAVTTHQRLLRRRNRHGALRERTRPTCLTVSIRTSFSPMGSYRWSDSSAVSCCHTCGVSSAIAVSLGCSYVESSGGAVWRSEYPLRSPSRSLMSL
ncbi:hypothetical protein INR49_005844 [Caranx melampygus]|nr:hypothetical protein INR49_005844 [Caranx melampygus]